MHSDTNSTSNSFPKRVKKVNKSILLNTIVVRAVADVSEHDSPSPVPVWVKDVSNEIFVL